MLTGGVTRTGITCGIANAADDVTVGELTDTTITRGSADFADDITAADVIAEVSFVTYGRRC